MFEKLPLHVLALLVNKNVVTEDQIRDAVSVVTGGQSRHSLSDDGFFKYAAELGERCNLTED